MVRAAARKLTGCPNCTLGSLGVALSALIVVAFVGDLHSRYDEAIARANQATRNYAEVLAADAARAFEGVDRSLRVAELARRDIGTGPYASEAARLAAARRAHDALEQIQRSS